MYQKIAIVSLLAAHVFAGAMGQEQGVISNSGLSNSLRNRIPFMFSSEAVGAYVPSPETMRSAGCATGAAATLVGTGALVKYIGLIDGAFSSNRFKANVRNNKIKTGLGAFGLLGVFSGFTAEAFRPGSIMGLFASAYTGASTRFSAVFTESLPSVPSWVTPQNGAVAVISATALALAGNAAYKNREAIGAGAKVLGSGVAGHAKTAWTFAGKNKKGIATGAGLLGLGFAGWYYGLPGKIANVDYSGIWASLYGEMPSMPSASSFVPSVNTQRDAALVGAGLALIGAAYFNNQAQKACLRAQESEEAREQVIAHRDEYAAQQVAFAVQVPNAKLDNLATSLECDRDAIVRTMVERQGLLQRLEAQVRGLCDDLQVANIDEIPGAIVNLKGRGQILGGELAAVKEALSLEGEETVAGKIATLQAAIANAEASKEAALVQLKIAQADEQALAVREATEDKAQEVAGLTQEVADLEVQLKELRAQKASADQLVAILKTMAPTAEQSLAAQKEFMVALTTMNAQTLAAVSSKRQAADQSTK